MADPLWLDEREARAWRQNLLMQTRLERRLARMLQRDSGLSSADYEVLVNLSEAPDQRLRVFELGQATQWETSRLSHHLTRMERRGLVRREPCETDNRGAHIALTAAGLASIAEAAPTHVEHVRRWFIDVLSPQQLDALAGIADTVLARLDDDPEPS